MQAALTAYSLCTLLCRSSPPSCRQDFVPICAPFNSCFANVCFNAPTISDSAPPMSLPLFVGVTSLFPVTMEMQSCRVGITQKGKMLPAWQQRQQPCRRPPSVAAAAPGSGKGTFAFRSGGSEWREAWLSPFAAAGFRSRALSQSGLPGASHKRETPAALASGLRACSLHHRAPSPAPARALHRCQTAAH